MIVTTALSKAPNHAHTFPVPGLVDSHRCSEQACGCRFLRKLWGSYHPAFIHNRVGVCVFVNTLTLKAVHDIVSEKKNRLEIRLYQTILFL